MFTLFADSGLMPVSFIRVRPPRIGAKNVKFARIGPANYAMYTQNDGAWVKNAAEETQMVEAMRKGAELVIKSVSTQGTKTTDTYSLKGISQALDRVAQECN